MQYILNREESLRTDLTDRLCIAFMFNAGQFPDSISTNTL